MTRSFLLGALLALLASATGSPARSQEARGPAEEAAAAFAGLEARLLAASEVRLAFDITSEGAYQSALRGTLEIDRGDRVALVATGTFGGRPVELRVESDGRTYAYGNGVELRTGEAPPRLEEALLIGLTRMGLLHNLAVLTAGSPPDHADGGVREWVETRDFGWSADGRPTVRFSIDVSETPAGTVTLALDSDGNPLSRIQIVKFPQGEMRVVEGYTDVAVVP